MGLALLLAMAVAPGVTFFALQSQQSDRAAVDLVRTELSATQRRLPA